MDVAYIITDSYLPIFGVSLYSLLENSRDLNFLEVHVLSPDLTRQSRYVIEKLTARYGRKAHFYDISDYKGKLPRIWDTSGYHSIVLARLLLADYLPESMDTVLYLDCDVVVNGSLLPLERANLANFAFAAVPQLHMPEAQKQALDLSLEDLYYNAGVLLINLRYWRSHNLQREFLSYFEQMQGRLLYNDQDILNHCCRGAVLPLPLTYNLDPAAHYFPISFMEKYQSAYFREGHKAYRLALKQPVIIHYAGDERPWCRGNFSPYRSVYEYYKQGSPWREEPQIRGRELHLFCYHILNLITRICPWFRKAFTERVGIYYYKLVQKK